MFKTNKSNPIISHTMITEWDMKSGNTSILREFSLIPEKKIEKIEQMSRELRQKEVGLLQKKDKSLASKLEAGFDEIITRFIAVNELENDDIISIKRDAIFIRSRTPKFQTIGQYCTFRPKGVYSAFLLLDGKEFYMTPDSFDIKGFPDDKVSLHNNGILSYVHAFLEDFDYDMRGLNQYCKEFVSAYKNKELPIEFYREFSSDSQFKILDYTGENWYGLESIDESMLDKLIISYNYEHIVIPLIQYLF